MCAALHQALLKCPPYSLYEGPARFRLNRKSSVLSSVSRFALLRSYPLGPHTRTRFERERDHVVISIVSAFHTRFETKAVPGARIAGTRRRATERLKAHAELVLVRSTSCYNTLKAGIIFFPRNFKLDYTLMDEADQCQ